MPFDAPPPAPERVPIAALDRTVCRMVRSRERPDVVARYAASDEANPGCLPPVDVFRGGGVLLLADGGHRVAALEANGREFVPALVRDLPTEAAAEAAACAHAAGANAAHGADRTQAEAERAVELAIHTQPAGLSDKDIARMCHVSPHTAAKVRCRLSDAGDLTGERAVGRHRYPATGRPHGFPTPTAAAARPRPPQGSKYDRHRRPVPERLRAVFTATEYSQWFWRTGQQLDAMAERIEERLGRPELAAVVEATADAGLASVADAVREVRRRLAADEPSAVCPPCGGGGCARCDSRGWLTEAGYAGLPAADRGAG